LASKTGTINADGGQVAITAAAARAVVDGVVNVGGRINARSVTNERGVIVFGGGESTQVNVNGTIDVSGGATQKGGTVTVTASKVNVASTARINANGGAGGGTVLVGGGRQGQGPITNAGFTTVERGAVITADAVELGNGGTVVVWADNTTVFGGTISARGGAQGGNGGFAEVSGKSRLHFDGMVDLRAAAGLVGTLLLDPSDITISAGGDSNIDVSGGTVTGTADSSNISVATLETLLTTADVIIDATGGPGSGGGTITILDSVSSFSGNDLTLRALGNIAVNGALSLSFSTISFNSTAGQLTQTAPITADTVTFAVGGVVALTNSGNMIDDVSGTAGKSISIVNAQTLAVTSDGLTAGAFSSVTLTTLGASSDIFINGTVTGFGITLNAGGDVFGGIPARDESSAIIIDYHPFINDTSVTFWPKVQPQLTKTPDISFTILSDCQLAKEALACGAPTFDDGVPLSDDDLVPVNLGNEELIFANRRRPPTPKN
ncbi:MAG: hypothetical protein AB7O88_23210, partial [Reyranellaceae bacterium]